MKPTGQLLILVGTSLLAVTATLVAANDIIIPGPQWDLQ